MSVLHVGISALNLVLGEEEAAGLLSKLGLTTLPVSTTLKVPVHISEILHTVMDNEMEGESRRIYGQAKCLEYFVALINYLKTTSPLNSKIEQIAEELLRLEGKIPNMKDIACRHGISLNRLNKEFRRAFKTTVHGYVTDFRLKNAHKKLLEGDLPMKAISAELGYSHVNHFITAFKRKFGYTPGSLRRNMFQ